ncbi:MAG: glycosyltransferase family 25 protein [Vicinamibacteria bacterium]|nr:glycosyltransferase family 25 protein [Vicinamibacteria bacterium]
MLRELIVLNLRRSPERRAYMTAQAERLGLLVEFVESVDAEDLKRLGGEAPPGLSFGEWACLKTHSLVWRRVRESDRPAVVLEDDVELLPSFPEVVAAALATLPKDALLLLGHHSTLRGPREGARLCFMKTPLAPGHHMARVAEFPMGAYAMVISPGAAKRLAKFAEPERMAADWVTGYCPRAGVSLLAVTPPCAIPSPIAQQSTIPDRPKGVEQGHVSRKAPGVLSEAWLFIRRLGIATSAYTFRLER